MARRVSDTVPGRNGGVFGFPRGGTRWKRMAPQTTHSKILRPQAGTSKRPLQPSLTGRQPAAASIKVRAYISARVGSDATDAHWRAVTAQAIGPERGAVRR